MACPSTFSSMALSKSSLTFSGASFAAPAGAAAAAALTALTGAAFALAAGEPVPPGPAVGARWGCAVAAATPSILACFWMVPHTAADGGSAGSAQKGLRRAWAEALAQRGLAARVAQVLLIHGGPRVRLGTLQNRREINGPRAVTAAMDVPQPRTDECSLVEQDDDDASTVAEEAQEGGAGQRLTAADVQLLERLTGVLDPDLHALLGTALARSEAQVHKHERRTQRHEQGRHARPRRGGLHCVSCLALQRRPSWCQCWTS